jgi:hypothetical protein
VEKFLLRAKQKFNSIVNRIWKNWT